MIYLNSVANSSITSLRQREMKAFQRKNAPRSAVEEQSNRFSRISHTVRIIMLVYILASYDVPNEILLLIEFFLSGRKNV